MPRPLRSSCDRCHSQKLKCPKEQGSATCSRCLKAGADCVFSPAGAAWRRASANTACQSSPLLQRPSQGAGNFDLHLTWPWPPSLDAGNLSVNELGYISPLSDPVAYKTPEDPRSACVRQLTNLAVEIHQVSVELSPVASFHLPKGTNPEEFYSKHVIHISHSRCLEQLFILAQRLIDLYPELLRLLLGESHPHPWEECQDPDCIHNSDMVEEFAHIFPEADLLQGKIDTFLFKLLTACHEKVSDVFDYLAMATKLCAKVCKASPDLIQPSLHIPELRVGNFVASATSSSSMQATLVAHITSVLKENAKLLRETLEDASTGASSLDKEMRMMLLQCELLEERSQLQADQFIQIRDGLTKVNLHQRKH
ncbi:hypothetical protein HD806DRAFT_121591 [Xylariaceae sp. AK1471]|nr:hypothetical protein HD806DRAFT_121591 [Xylariaceae sp. AK1471]